MKENLNKDQDTISVSLYLDRLNSTLKTEKARVVGEVSGLQEYPGRSYMYFSLKDSKDQSTVKCFMWKNDYRMSGISIKDGLEVIVTAYPNIYKPNGGLTLQVEMVELVGEGALKIAYDELKNKLEKEGLFSIDRKREIPEYPHRIGVITSKSGAVINDFLTNIGKFGYEILFVDSKVEGQDAVKDIFTSLQTLKKKEIDVLVLMRGGGSLESFLAFNNEAIVREVASFPVPVITGIGHDKDIPLVSLVSDKNVSTPTAVTHILNQSWNEAFSVVSSTEDKILSRYDSILNEVRFNIEHSFVSIEREFGGLLNILKDSEKSLAYALELISSKIKHINDIIKNNSDNLLRNFSLLIKRSLDSLDSLDKQLQLSSPERALSQGYSIVKLQGKLVRKMKDVKSGDELDVEVSDGIIKTEVK